MVRGMEGFPWTLTDFLFEFLGTTMDEMRERITSFQQMDDILVLCPARYLRGDRLVCARMVQRMDDILVLESCSE